MSTYALYLDTTPSKHYNTSELVVSFGLREQENLTGPYAYGSLSAEGIEDILLVLMEAALSGGQFSSPHSIRAYYEDFSFTLHDDHILFEHNFEDEDPVKHPMSKGEYAMLLLRALDACHNLNGVRA
jgi:hypothetical protein